MANKELRGGEKSAQAVGKMGKNTDKQAEMRAVWQRIQDEHAGVSNANQSDDGGGKSGKASGNKRGGRSSLAFRIILPIFIIENIALIVVVIMFLVGTIGITTKSSGGKTVAVYNVCSDLVDEYNNIYNSGDISNSQERVTSIAQEASARDSSDKDATCQYLIFRGAISDLDVDAAQAAVDKLKGLAESNIYPDGGLRGGSTDVDDMQRSVDSIRAAVTSTGDEATVKGQG